MKTRLLILFFALNLLKGFASETATFYFRIDSPVAVCKPIITIFKESKQALIENIKANLPAGSSLVGDDKSGTISATYRQYVLVSDYSITGDNITWIVKQKPAIATCKRVEKTIRQLLEEMKGPGGIVRLKPFDFFKYLFK